MNKAGAGSQLIGVHWGIN